MKNNLLHLREIHGITQEQLGEAINVSRQTIISIEKGVYNPSLLLAFKLADYFNLSIHEIFIFQKETNN